MTKYRRGWGERLACSAWRSSGDFTAGPSRTASTELLVRASAYAGVCRQGTHRLELPDKGGARLIPDVLKVRRVRVVLIGGPPGALAAFG